MEELRRVCDVLNVELANTWFTGFDGLITARVICNPIDFTNRLRDVVLNRVYVPRFILKVVPIIKVVSTDLDVIESEAVKMAHEMIGENETYRIDVRKRGVSYHRIEIIERIARNVKRKVNLERPDKIIHVEVFPSRTGLCVCRETDIFSLLKITLSTT